MKKVNVKDQINILNHLVKNTTGMTAGSLSLVLMAFKELEKKGVEKVILLDTETEYINPNIYGQMTGQWIDYEPNLKYKPFRFI